MSSYKTDRRGAATKHVINMTLKAIGVGGLMGVAVVAPNALAALDTLGVFHAATPKQKRSRYLAELKRQGLIIASHDADEVRLQLTVKGIHRLQRLEIEELIIARQKHWDKHWRMVVFDIPAAHKDQRYIFLSQLRRLGFVMVRQSTWYHAYPCFDIVDQLVRFCGLSQFVTTAEISRLDESTTRKLLRYFPEITS